MNGQRFRPLWAVSFASLLLICAQASAQPPQTAANAVNVVPALDGVFDAFASHPIVAIGDDHGLAQSLDFYAAVVRDPRFATDVGNLVVEFGGAAHQDVLDRYLAGETVPYTELRKVWTDVVSGPELYIGYMNIFAQVRATNMTLPAEKRIHIFLGEPPIDWSRIRTPSEQLPYQAQRQSYPAELVRREILGKGKKALMIYGGGHLYRERYYYPYAEGAGANPRARAVLWKFLSDLAAGTPDYRSFTPAWSEQVRRTASGLTRSVVSYGDLRSIAFLGRTGSEDVFVAEFSGAKIKVHARLNDRDKLDLASWEPTPCRDAGGTITDRIEAAAPGSVFVVAVYTGYPQKTCSDHFERAHAGWTAPALARPVRGSLARDQSADGCRPYMAAVADGLLYLGPATSLTMGAEHPDIYLDEAYRREEDRRWQIQGDAPLPPSTDLRDHPSAPKKVWPY
jgi:hypothetical protein